MKRLVVPMLDGKLIADVSTDPDYPGIDVEFVADHENETDLSRPRVLIEQAPEEGVRALIWNNPKSEDFELGFILYPEKENTLTEINEKGKLIVPVKSGVLIATAEDTGIFVKLIIRGKWHPKVFIHQTDEKIHATIWNKPYIECATNNIEMYSCKTNRSGMSIRTLIQNLQEIEKKHPDAVVKMHHPEGNGIMFAVASKDGNVWLEGREDMDVIEELRSQYEIAAETQRDELDFFTEMVDRGFTLTDFCFALPNDQYLYAKSFMEEHGLI